MAITIHELKRKIDTEIETIKTNLVACEDREETARLQADGRVLLKVRSWLDDSSSAPKTVSDGSGY